MPPCSICHFKIKELPHWLFAIWISNDTITFFGEIEITIDKFKPGHTSVLYTDVGWFIQEIYSIIDKGGFRTLEQEKEYLETKSMIDEASIFNLETHQLIKQLLHDTLDDGHDVEFTENVGWDPHYHFDILDPITKQVSDDIETKVNLINDRGSYNYYHHDIQFDVYTTKETNLI